MFSLKLNLVRGDKAIAAAEESEEEDRVEDRRAVFREAQLTLEEYFKIRAVIVELSPAGARVRYANRIDLPSRLRISEPTLDINCWARVVWQREGMAGLVFVTED
ncbi:MAG: hypothetical protein ABUS48_04980 [Pseudomonadota bacterium]